MVSDSKIEIKTIIAIIENGYCKNDKALFFIIFIICRDPSWQNFHTPNQYYIK